MLHVRSILLVPVLGAIALAGCSESPPPKTPRGNSDAVPANSLSDAKLHGEEDEEGSASRDPKDDPTQPYVVSVEDAPAPDPVPSKTTASAGGSGPVSKTECNRVFDRYIELEVGQNPRLAGVPPHVIEQAKQMTRQQHGEAPCTATRAQYRCAMAATSTAAWQRCMK